jgi:hypothetical protein
MLVVFPRLISQLKTPIFIKRIKQMPIKLKFLFRRIYRLLTISKSSHYVWKDLVKYHKRSGWRYGQFDNEKSIECGFKVDDINSVDFNYTVSSGRLLFSSTILQNFDEGLTNDILVLASHFNGLLNFGTVKVSVKYNYVEFFYSRDLLTYSLYPGEINSDTDTHFELTKDVFWAFNNMIITGDDPVFVFSELMRNKENNNTQDT